MTDTDPPLRSSRIQGAWESSRTVTFCRGRMNLYSGPLLASAHPMMHATSINSNELHLYIYYKRRRCADKLSLSLQRGKIKGVEMCMCYKVAV